MVSCESEKSEPKKTRREILIEKQKEQREVEKLKQSQSKFMDSFSKEWNKMPYKKIGLLELRDYKKDTVRFAFIFNRKPAGLGEIKKITREAAKLALKILVEQGRRPAEEWLSLFVWAEKPEIGETGKKLMRIYGRTFYDFNTDSLKWVPLKN